MGTDIKPSLSLKNKYWISGHRYYELRHYCLQYPEWKKEIKDYLLSSSVPPGEIKGQIEFSDPTSGKAGKIEAPSENIRLVEETAKETDPSIAPYHLLSVTQGLSYEKLKARLDIPCGRQMFYARYRKFFWLLSKKRHAGDR